MRITSLVAMLSIASLSLYIVNTTREAGAFCLFSCGPSDEDVEQAFSMMAAKAYRKPYQVLSVTREDSIKRTVRGAEAHDIHFKAVIKFPRHITCREATCMYEIMLFGRPKQNKTTKEVTINAWMRLVRTEKGWAIARVR